MILPSEAWMDQRRFKPLHEAGATLKEIAAEVGCDPRTVKKYLTRPGPATGRAAAGRHPTAADRPLGPGGRRVAGRRHRVAGDGDP